MSKLNDELLSDIDEGLLEEVSGLERLKDGAYNIRKNGQGIERKVTENVNTKLFGAEAEEVCATFSTSLLPIDERSISFV